VVAAVYIALALVSAATLIYEVALTRLLSVVAWYYLAFVSVSMAMLGLTAGALRVQLGPGRLSPEEALWEMSRAAVAMGLSLPVALVAMLAIPIEVSRTLETLFVFVFFCGVVAVPFFFAGPPPASR
jgi:hypothetical protein